MRHVSSRAKRGLCTSATCRSLAAHGMTLLGSIAHAQAVNGIVRDSTTRLALAGAVVELLDQNGASLGRTLTSGTGSFTLTVDPKTDRLRLVRIGFRPRDIRVKPDSIIGTYVEIVMSRLPTMLDKVNVVAGAKCDQRTNAAGQAFLQQARAGLLATIVGREVSPAKLVRLSYERTYGPRLDTMMPAVRMDSIAEAKTSFRAARRGVDLVQRGFTTDSLGTGIYFGPDAEVLLDEGFEQGYCFYITERRGQTGLGFSPAQARRIGRVDVEGVLWIDTKERALRSLEYRYVGLGRESEDNNVGGQVVYQEMPNGVVIVSRWSLRLLKVRVDSQQYRYGRLPTGRIVVSEGGGVVARAEWPDGTKWSAGLGTLEVTAIDGENGRRVSGAEVRLKNTNLVAISDKNGVAKFSDVFPGRYAIDIANRALDSLGFVVTQAASKARQLDTAVIRPSLVAADTGTELLLRTVDVYAGRTARQPAPMRTITQFAEASCKPPKGKTPKRAIIGRIQFADGAEVVGVGEVAAAGIAESRPTQPGGAFLICVPDEWVGPVWLSGQLGRLHADEAVVELGDRVTFAKLIVSR